MSQLIMHKKGDKLYLPSSFYLSHGEDDFQGGLATIKSFGISENMPDDHYNKVMVSFEERDSVSYNYKYVLENQEEWAKEYEGRIAHNDPDINRPWIEKGDIVNGSVWDGEDIW